MDKTLAAHCARMSALAYDGADKVCAALPSATVALIDNDDTQAYTIEWPTLAVVAFRGTQVTARWSWADIRTNLLQGRKVWLGRDDQWVHGGYLEAVMDVMPQVRAFAEAQRRAGRRVVFTGHSLGGVLATLATAAIDVHAAYTFGAPRCGNSAFAAALGGRNLHRIVYGMDIAPSYPSARLGYRHGGTRWQLGRDGSLMRGGGWRDWFHLPVATGILAHRVCNYVDALEPRFAGPCVAFRVSLAAKSVPNQ